jgi:hypothetical protein
MVLDELTIDDQSRYLAILFFWKQKKLSNELNGDPDLGNSPAFDCIMNWICQIQKKKCLSGELEPVLRWASLILRDSEEEWQSLVALRKTKPLSEWYRQDYLQSNLWKSLRAIVLENDGNRCLLCDAEARFVHHVSYDDTIMRGLDLRCLWFLCGGCHDAVEFDGDRKLSIFESSTRLEARYRQRFSE